MSINLCKYRIFKKAYLKCGSIKVKIYSKNNFKNIFVPMEHRSPNQDYDDKDWEDEGYNYRLDYPVEDIYYAYDKIGDSYQVVGHLGLDSNLQVKAVYVSPSYRRKGVAEKLYYSAFISNPLVMSDDYDSMEPEIKKLWDKMYDKMPEKIEKLDNKSYIYRS